MIQRIQSVYLLITFIALVLLSIGKDIFTHEISQKDQFEWVTHANGCGLQSDITLQKGVTPQQITVLRASSNLPSLSAGNTVNSNSIISFPFYSIPILLALFTLVVLFGFKNLKRQFQLSRILFIGTFLLAVMGGFMYAFTLHTVPSLSHSNDAMTFEIGSYCLVAALIFSFMAMRSIGKDLKLIKSVDRIR